MSTIKTIGKRSAFNFFYHFSYSVIFSSGVSNLQRSYLIKASTFDLKVSIKEHYASA